MDYSNAWSTEIAQIIKSNQSHNKVGATIGDILKLDPLTISILDGNVILNSEAHNIYISTNIISDYQREFEIEGDIQFTDSNCGTTTADGACQTAGNHTHGVATINIDTEYNAQGKITLVDTIEVGDKVLLVADESDSSFFVVSVLKKV